MNERTNTTTTGSASGTDATSPTHNMPVHARSHTMSKTAPARVSCPSRRADQPSAMSPAQKTAYATASSVRSPRAMAIAPSSTATTVRVAVTMFGTVAKGPTGSRPGDAGATAALPGSTGRFVMPFTVGPAS